MFSRKFRFVFIFVFLFFFALVGTVFGQASQCQSRNIIFGGSITPTPEKITGYVSYFMRESSCYDVLHSASVMLEIRNPTTRELLHRVGGQNIGTQGVSDLPFASFDPSILGDGRYRAIFTLSLRAKNDSTPVLFATKVHYHDFTIRSVISTPTPSPTPVPQANITGYTFPNLSSIGCPDLDRELRETSGVNIGISSSKVNHGFSTTHKIALSVKKKCSFSGVGIKLTSPNGEKIDTHYSVRMSAIATVNDLKVLIHDINNTGIADMQFNAELSLSTYLQNGESVGKFDLGPYSTRDRSAKMYISNDEKDLNRLHIKMVLSFYTLNGRIYHVPQSGTFVPVGTNVGANVGSSTGANPTPTSYPVETIDTTAPQILLTGIAQKSGYADVSGQLDLKVVISDPAGIKSILVNTFGKTQLETNTYTKGIFTGIYKVDTTELVNGTYPITVVATDNYANVKNVSVLARVLNASSASDTPLNEVEEDPSPAEEEQGESSAEQGQSTLPEESAPEDGVDDSGVVSDFESPSTEPLQNVSQLFERLTQLMSQLTDLLAAMQTMTTTSQAKAFTLRSAEVEILDDSTDADGTYFTELILANRAELKSIPQTKKLPRLTTRFKRRLQKVQSSSRVKKRSRNVRKAQRALKRVLSRLQ